MLLNRIVARQTQNNELAATKTQKLRDTLQVQQLYRDIDELDSWIMQQLQVVRCESKALTAMQVATDENYKDPSNLLGKVTKHQVNIGR